MTVVKKERKIIRRLLIENAAKDVEKKAFIIAIEGNKGTGKNELKLGLMQHIVQQGAAIYSYKESQYDPFAESRREIQKRYSHSDKNGESQILSLISAGRKHMIHNSPVKEWLNNEKAVVLIDRYILTTLAHQYASGNDIKDSLGLMKGSYLLPDICFLLRCSDPRAAQLRMLARSEQGRDPESEALDPEKISLYEKAYADISDYLPANSHTLAIDTTHLSIEEVIANAISHYNIVRK